MSEELSVPYNNLKTTISRDQLRNGIQAMGLNVDLIVSMATDFKYLTAVVYELDEDGHPQVRDGKLATMTTTTPVIP